MQTHDEKLRVLGKKSFLTFYPYLFIMIGMILCISLVNWIIYLHPQNFNFYQNKLYINTNVILSAIIVLLFRKRLISGVVSDIDSRLIYFVVLVISIATPVYYSQIFLEDLTTKVIHLNDISEISGKKAAKFFSVGNYKINQNELGSYFLAEKEHRMKGSHIGWIMDFFFVFPLFSEQEQDPDPIIWMGLHFHRRTGTGYLDSSSFEHVKSQFLQEVREKVINLNISKFNYLELLSDYDINNGLDNAQQRSIRKYNPQEVVLLAHYKPIKNRRLEDLNDFIAALVACSLIWYFFNFLIFLKDFDK